MGFQETDGQWRTSDSVNLSHMRGLTRHCRWHRRRRWKLSGMDTSGSCAEIVDARTSAGDIRILVNGCRRQVTAGMHQLVGSTHRIVGSAPQVVD